MQQQLAPGLCIAVADTPRPDHARDQARRRPQGVQGQALSRPKGANALVAVACCRVCLWIITRDKRREEKREKEQVRGHKGESAARCSRRARVARDGRGRAQSVVVLSNVSSCADDREALPPGHTGEPVCRREVSIHTLHRPCVLGHQPTVHPCGAADTRTIALVRLHVDTNTKLATRDWLAGWPAALVLRCQALHTRPGTLVRSPPPHSCGWAVWTEGF